jgi:TetR/AcrR family transcriptional repressor of nem operon
MASKGEVTRARILDAAQAMILERGYAGMSVDALISSLGLTKGAFFHHFRSKDDLAQTLIRRYADEGLDMLRDNLARVKKLGDDPVQRIRILVGLYEEMFEQLTEPYPGCLLASYIYELHQFGDDMRMVLNEEFLLSRTELSTLIREAMQLYPPRVDIDPVAVADMFMSTLEGAFILSKSLGEAAITAQQLRLYRNFIEVLFRSD